MVQFAQTEGETHRARRREGETRRAFKATRLTVPDKRGRERLPSALLVEEEEPESTEDTRGTYVDSQSAAPEQMMVQEGSIPTTYLPTGSSEPQGEDNESAMVMYGRNSRPTQTIRPAPIEQADRNVRFQRPGWQGCYNHPQQSSARPKTRGTICHIFYTIDDHIAPQCTLTLREQRKVIDNLELLSKHQKGKVPHD